MDYKILDIKRISTQVLRVDIEFEPGAIIPMMLSADWHWDNPHTDRTLLEKDLNTAKEKGALIVGAGDIFCAMQGKGDRRHNKADVRPEHMVGNYLDALSETHVDWVAPWVDNLLMYSKGNHETAILQHKEVDLIGDTTKGIKYAHGKKVHSMPYAGWIFIRLMAKAKNKYHTLRTIRIAYTHGHGGGGIGTKGTLWPTRRAAFRPDADVVFAGHIHEKWLFPVMQEKVDNNGVITIKEQVHVQIPTYKEEYIGGDGYHNEKGRPPKPLGCWFMNIEMVNAKHPVTGTWMKTAELNFQPSKKPLII